MWKYIYPLAKEIKSSSVNTEFSYCSVVVLSQIHRIKKWLHVWRDEIKKTVSKAVIVALKTLNGIE